MNNDMYNNILNFYTGCDIFRFWNFDRSVHPYLPPFPWPRLPPPGINFPPSMYNVPPPVFRLPSPLNLHMPQLPSLQLQPLLHPPLLPPREAPFLFPPPPPIELPRSLPPIELPSAPLPELPALQPQLPPAPAPIHLPPAPPPLQLQAAPLQEQSNKLPPPHEPILALSQFKRPQPVTSNKSTAIKKRTATQTRNTARKKKARVEDENCLAPISSHWNLFNSAFPTSEIIRRYPITEDKYKKMCYLLKSECRMRNSNCLYERGCPQQLFVYSSRHVDAHKLHRLITEAVDVAFLLAGKHKVFSSDTITTIISQLLPTAWVLDTCYWPFYHIGGQTLCVCRFYGQRCPHAFMCDQFIDIEPPSTTQLKIEPPAFVSSNSLGQTVPRELHISVGYSVNRHEMNAIVSMEIERKDYNEIYNYGKVQLFMQFRLMHELRRPLMDVKLHPHPRRYKYYGRYQRENVDHDDPPVDHEIKYFDRPRFTLYPIVSWECVQIDEYNPDEL